MKLVIVESPAKAKTIEKYLHDIDGRGGYTVRASVGHVRDLPKSNKQAIDIPAGFVPHYEIVPGKAKVIHELQDLADKADEVILATDPDREGEAIAWHIQEELSGGKRQAASKAKARSSKSARGFDRIVFHEITKDAIAEALKHPRKIDKHLLAAQEARRVLDRLVGYDLSGLIWKKVRYGLSAGRVQSPALRILMEREREIRAFVPETYYIITAQTKTPRGDALVLTCAEEPRMKDEAERIIATVKKEQLSVAEVAETEARRSPRAPFTTSTLQQAASSRLGFSPARTMQTAQRLYEAGLITYMRTDSTNLAAPARQQILNEAQKTFGAAYAASRVFKTASKNAQEAHEAIRPTDIRKASAGSTPEQKRLYDLIWRRTLASQMADAEILRTKILAETPGKTVPQFVANGSRVLFDGWLKADPATRGEDVKLPEVKSGEKLTVEDISAEEKQTKPPPRYSEAGLVRELEKRGIGRPSTYAAIIKTLGDRGYVVKEGRSLQPTDVGDVVSTFLEKNFTNYISDTFTAEMEDELDDIANGKREYVKTLKDFYGPFTKELKSKNTAEKITDLGPAPKEFPCPVCGSAMVYKLSRGGKFMSCARFPECIGARTESGEILEKKNAEPIGTDPMSGLPIYVLTGRFGPFVQLGETPQGKGKSKKEKPRRASIPKEKDPEAVTLAEALKYLSLPRVLGNHPETNEPISANIGRFGPYIVHQKDFRSLKTDDVYTIDLARALQIFKEPKKTRGFARKKK
ncbi:MAG: type I DNA topoisomerase [Minisyncoccia bacterium]